MSIMARSDVDVHVYLDGTSELDVGIVDDTAVIRNQAFELVFSREALAVFAPRLVQLWRQIRDRDTDAAML